MTITSAVMVLTLMVPSIPAHALIDYEIPAYVEGDGFGMGVAYYCGVDYYYADGLTILTVERTDYGDYVSVMGFYATIYDEDGEFLEYEFVEQDLYTGSQAVMQSIHEYYEYKADYRTC